MNVTVRLMPTEVEDDDGMVKCEGELVLTLKNAAFFFTLILMYKEERRGIRYTALYKDGKPWVSMIGSLRQDIISEYSQAQFEVLGLINELFAAVLSFSSIYPEACYSCSPKRPEPAILEIERALLAGRA